PLPAAPANSPQPARVGSCRCRQWRTCLSAHSYSSLQFAPTCAKLQALQARQNLVAKDGHLAHVVDQDQSHPVQSGFGQPQELLGDLVVATDDRKGGAPADHALHHSAHQFWRKGLSIASSTLGNNLFGGLPVSLLSHQIVL